MSAPEQQDIDLSDAQRENEIDHWYLALSSAKTPAARRRANERMTSLIRQRSSRQIERMEQQQGLRQANGEDTQ